MFKKILAAALIGVMAISLAACGSSQNNAVKTETNVSEKEEGKESESTETKETPETSEPVIYPAQKLLIGVEIYDPTDAEFLELKKYYDKISQNMNIEFKYSEAITDADSELKFIEDCATAGCQAFIAYYNVSGATQIETAIGYDMYVWGLAEESYALAFYDNEHYVGAVTAGSYEYEAGKALGEWVVENGFDTVVYSSGGADFGVGMFIDRQNGFYDGLGNADVKVVTVSGFPGDQFFADQSAALGTEGLDAVVASFNGVDFWAQPIATAGLQDKVKLATIGSISQAYADAFNNEQIDFLCAKNIQMFGLAATMLSNAVDGNRDNLTMDGLAQNIVAPGWTIDNYDDCKALLEIQEGTGVFTMEDIKSYSKAYNPDATLDTLLNLVNDATIEKLIGK